MEIDKKKKKIKILKSELAETKKKNEELEIRAIVM